MLNSPYRVCVCVLRVGPYTSSHPEYFVRVPQGTQPPYDPSVYLSTGIAYGSSGYGPWMYVHAVVLLSVMLQCGFDVVFVLFCFDRDTAQFNYWKYVLIS